MAKVFGSIGGAFGYAAKNTFKNPGVWFLVTVVAILEIIAGIIGVLYLALGILANIFGEAFRTFLDSVLSVIPGLSGVKSTILDLIPNGGGSIAIGIVGIVISLLFFFFLEGLQTKIFAGQDISFSGFFGTVGRGFQLWLISLIYDIIVIIVMVAAVITIFAGTNPITPVSDLSDIPNVLGAFGIWSIITIVLLLFFAIFKYPALMNFSRKGKFGAAFNFKEIGGIIGATKWYKILLGVIVNTILLILMCLVLGLICELIGLVPGIAGAILGLIIISLGSIFIFYLWSSYYAKLIENKA